MALEGIWVTSAAMRNWLALGFWLVFLGAVAYARTFHHSDLDSFYSVWRSGNPILWYSAMLCMASWLSYSSIRDASSASPSKLVYVPALILGPLGVIASAICLLFALSDAL